jgi:hypothetical protein
MSGDWTFDAIVMLPLKASQVRKTKTISNFRIYAIGSSFCQYIYSLVYMIRDDPSSLVNRRSASTTLAPGIPMLEHSRTFTIQEMLWFERQADCSAGYSYIQAETHPNWRRSVQVCVRGDERRRQ